jgi:[protein-PII] uridylyltransferase
VKEAGDKLAHRHFDHKMKISFSHNEKWNLTQVEVNVIDKQGLLSNIAYIFHQLDINLVNARITTFGERVEDIFFISNAKKQPLSTVEEKRLKQTLEEKL